MMRTAQPVRRLVAVGLVVLVSALGGIAVVQAHAHYDHSTPGIGEVVQAAPARVDIYTDQDMAKVGNANTISVTNTSGQQVTTGATTVDDADRRHFWVGLQPDLQAGRYVVAFSTLSDVDNDTDHGRFAFYIGRSPTAQEKQLDAQLTSAPVADADGGSSSHTGLIAGIAAVVAAVLVVGGGAVVVLKRR
jgi:methionine-rich copper-binding protein CopC